jgi:hypothetical protein
MNWVPQDKFINKLSHTSVVDNPTSNVIDFYSLFRVGALSKAQQEIWPNSIYRGHLADFKELDDAIAYCKNLKESECENGFELFLIKITEEVVEIK